jgi:hypothetical protein
VIAIIAEQRVSKRAESLDWIYNGRDERENRRLLQAILQEKIDEEKNCTRNNDRERHRHLAAT